MESISHISFQNVETDYDVMISMRKGSDTRYIAYDTTMVANQLNIHTSRTSTVIFFISWLIKDPNLTLSTR